MQELTTKEYLQQIHMIQKRVERLEYVRTSLKADLYSVRSAAASLGSARVKSSFKDSRVNRILYKIETIDGNVLKEIDQLQDIRQAIVNQIEAIPDERLREILFQRYVRCEKWEGIANNLHFDVRYMYLLHARALPVFAEMFGNLYLTGPEAEAAVGSNKTDDFDLPIEQEGD